MDIMEQQPHADVDATEELLEMLKLFLLGVNVLLFVAAALVYATARKAPSTASPVAAADAPGNAKRALLVTAHPDDESMFFLPLVHSLTQQRDAADASSAATPEWELHLLCLSRGNFDGLGATREQEMHACGVFLGIAPRNIHVREDPMLQDGMHTQWDHAHIAKLVLEYMETHAIHAVFTFDDYGVSGHANHIAVHHGVARAVAEQHARCAAASIAGDHDDDNNDKSSGRRSASSSPRVRGWALESTSLARKYIGVLDAFVSSWTLRRDGAFVFLFRPQWNHAAMALHRSQFVWYRRLFVVFSRYSFVNTFQPIGGAASAPVAATTATTATQEDKKTQ